jgi:hypothetical protein
MSAVEEDQTLVLTAPPQRQRPRYLRMILLAMFAQYTIVSLVVGLSVAATLRYFVTPQIVAKFEALAVALKH